eukprot:scaffold56584_cov35-Attheya_sp.AAC.1
MSEASLCGTCDIVQRASQISHIRQLVLYTTGSDSEWRLVRASNGSGYTEKTFRQYTQSPSREPEPGQVFPPRDLEADVDTVSGEPYGNGAYDVRTSEFVNDNYGWQALSARVVRKIVAEI